MTNLFDIIYSDHPKPAIFSVFHSSKFNPMELEQKAPKQKR